jgi:APA family basic amino acid/polyamine antiporter
VAAILILPFDSSQATPAGSLPAGFALLTAFVIAFQAVIFTYDGWTGAIYFGEEMKDPGRSIPRATIGGVLLVMGLYLALNVAFLRAVPIGRMAGDPFVAATAATVVFGAQGDTVIRILMIVSLLAAANANQLIASRVPLALGRDRLLPPAATRVNAGGTPTTALFLGTGLALLLIATNTFDTILALLAFFFVANYALSFASVFVLRRREPSTPRPFRAMGYPWTTGVALAGSIAFLVASIVGDRSNSLRSLLLLAASVPVFLLVRGRGSNEGG